MKKIYFLFLLYSISIYGQTQIGADINGEALFDEFGRGVSISSNGTFLAIGAAGNNNYTGRVRVYQNISGVWFKIGSDINGEAMDDNSGYSVSLSSDGTIIAIGAQGNDGNGNASGHVRVYKFSSGVWSQIGSNINGEAANDGSGNSVSLSSDGSILAIGAYKNDGNGTDSGHVRVFKNISNVWTQIGSDINGEAANDLSGNSVSLSSDGSILAIGAIGNGSGSGHVRVYRNEFGVWTQIGSDIDGEAVLDLAGLSVSLSSDGSILAIGSPNSDKNGIDSGHVRVYKNISEVWTKIGSDIIGEAANDTSGRSVSLSSDGNILAIGADSNDENGLNSGHVRVYQNISGVWTKIGSDINGEAANDGSGSNVSLSSDGSTLAIGAIFNNSFIGHVRVYNLSTVLSSDSFILSNFSVYPNPASKVVTIDIEEDLKLEKVNIYNTLGQLVKTENKKVITLNSLAKGNYFFEVITNKGKATKQILVQ